MTYFLRVSLPLSLIQLLTFGHAHYELLCSSPVGACGTACSSYIRKEILYRHNKGEQRKELYCTVVFFLCEIA